MTARSLIIDGEGERQLVILALATLAIKTPTLSDSLKAIADRIGDNESSFDQLVKVLNTDELNCHGTHFD